MANVFPPVRTESRIPKKVVVELHGFENAAHEITSTTDVSPHGARVLTKHFWAPNQDVSVRAVPGKLSLRAHVIHCKPLPDSSFSIKPLPDSSFSIGLELLQPSENWPGLGEPHQPPLPH